jgi:hypothetical protein
MLPIAAGTWLQLRNMASTPLNCNYVQFIIPSYFHIPFYLLNEAGKRMTLVLEM